MSNLNTKLDMAEWEWRMLFLEDCPASEVEELKMAIRDEWADPEEILYDSYSDCIDLEIEARKHHKSLLF